MLKLESWIGGHLGEMGISRCLFGTKIWPQGLTLEQGMWTASAGLVGLALFFLGYWLIGKKNGVKPEQWNLKISLAGVGKTVLLAAAAVGMGYAITLLAKYFSRWISG